ncbi:right-handed parallel beta-helix repeat-containing protein [Flavobacterium sp. MMLR14_040]|uniref:right-handed parallel beta-helix repeat-containing protein n=1 Tax=Flavobacterium sp. MMLR14_040 TaxID=3093843 RepID=UPI00298F6610|nr:right-handed parallel beta-helix repeat-containing protein [Flavobacterium sp. MMLR14_040]MDW8851934.1 right-handed parallel beta-helix repeat-containing protein [Flavobacterium sp. MMLR14_040]
MKRKLLILFILISTYTFAADVTGNVFLDNTANSENCTITFTPVSPSAVLAEVTSQTNGSYSANIANGVYNIKYQKNGYLAYELLNIFINGTMKLDDVTLSSNNLVLVNGNVNGTWTKGNTYRVTGNIVVPTGQTLTIEEGVEIKFDGYYSLIVNGTLLANGSANNYIKFTSNSSSPTKKDWNQIAIYGTSKLDYCIIEYGKIKNDDNIGILHVLGNLDISNSIIRNSEQSAISIRNSANLTIRNNKIYNCAYGLSIDTTEKIIVENNEIFNLSIIGLNIYQAATSSVFKNNIIHDCLYYGVQLMNVDYTLERNIIYNNDSGIYVSYSKPNIINNTIIFNRDGISLYDNEAYKITNPVINSNIIAYNSNYAIYSRSTNKPQSVSYNLFSNNTAGTGNVLPVGVGPIITQNKNNTPSDAYYNIFVDPEFESTIQTESTFCHLKSDSPAVNAGDPSIIISNGTIVDIGAKELGGNLSTGEFTNNKLTKIKVFPNPTADFLSFETNQNYTFDSIKFFDINGKNIDQIKLDESKSSYFWKVSSHFNKGVFLYVVMNGNSIIDSGKFIKK